MSLCEIVVLSKFPQIFRAFEVSLVVDGFSGQRTVVWDVSGVKNVWAVDPRYEAPGWMRIFRETEFNIASNANIGLANVSRKHDVIYCGDDTRITEPGTITRLETIANDYPDIGILSPRILGHASTPQMDPPCFLTYVNFVTFPFVYIKREVFDQIGFLDQDTFEGYGFEDIDFCYRARRAGFKCAVAADVTVTHGYGKATYGSTFRQVKGEELMGKENHANHLRFAKKWGLKNEARDVYRELERVPPTESWRREIPAAGV